MFDYNNLPTCVSLFESLLYRDTVGVTNKNNNCIYAANVNKIWKMQIFLYAKMTFQSSLHTKHSIDYLCLILQVRMY